MILFVATEPKLSDRVWHENTWNSKRNLNDVCLAADSVDELTPGLRRLDGATRWLRAFDLDFTEPALILDAQAAEGEEFQLDGGAIGRE
jgi:hypothetical protein